MGSFSPFLSTLGESASTAAQLMGADRAWYRVDGVLVSAHPKSDLAGVKPGLEAAIAVTASGGYLTPSPTPFTQFVWRGADYPSVIATNSCDDYTDAGGPPATPFGNAFSGGSSFFGQYFSASCATNTPTPSLYCLHD